MKRCTILYHIFGKNMKKQFIGGWSGSDKNKASDDVG
jgi:hypothetical protein